VTGKQRDSTAINASLSALSGCFTANGNKH
jgi:hypothetical protein